VKIFTKMAKSPKSISSDTLEHLWHAPAIIAMILIGEGLALVLSLAPGGTGDRWVYFGLASLMIQWVILLTIAGLFLLKKPINVMSVTKSAWLALGLLLVSTCIVGTGSWYLMRTNISNNDTNLPMFLLRLLSIALCVGLLSLVAFQNHWHARHMAIKAKQAELEALTARIRPHFLFNTLNAGASLVHARPEEAEKLLLNLADLFRAALSGQQTISLADELNLAKRYVEIELLRFAERLNIQWDLPSPLPSIFVPALSIQPLIENAIKHGVEPSSTKTNVEVIVKSDAKTVTISVLNDMSKSKAGSSASGHQVGLSSSRERIRALSGGLAELNTRIEDDRFVAVITLPNNE
jgi:two-component system, LytTR family, sensor histidine kinase AlgZ